MWGKATVLTLGANFMQNDLVLFRFKGLFYTKSGSITANRVVNFWAVGSVKVLGRLSYY